MNRPFPRRTLLVNGTLGVLLAGGIGLAYLTVGDGGGDAAASTGVTAVARGTVVSAVSASGTVESTRTRSLSFGSSGTVARIYVKAGQRVASGDVLARLDQTEALESLDAAKANLAVAAGGDTSTERGYASYVQARNSYNAAGRKLAGTVLKAPFGGTVTAVNGTIGGSGTGTSSSSGTGTGTGAGGESDSTASASSAGTGFVELADTRRLQVKGNFTEADTAKLKTGQAASVTFDALTGATATGKITAIGLAPTTTDNVVKYPATVALSGVPAGVRLGQTATAEITVARAADVLYVPAAAVRTAGGQSTVTVVRAGRRAPVQVEIGVRGDQGTEIKSGLREGEQVVVAATGGATSDNARRGTQGGPGMRGGGVPGGGAPGGGGGGRP